MPNLIDSVHIRGFRSLADVEINGLPRAAVLIGANGSGKSNFIRFFEMMSWMISRRLNEFIQRQGGADDQLFGGSKVSPHMDATLAMRTEVGQYDYRFTLAHAHPDRLIFTDEAFRFSLNNHPTEAAWQHIGSGHPEARLIEVRDASEPVGVNRTTAENLSVWLLRTCSVYQFHDTSDGSSFKKRWDAEDSDYLRSDGGNLAAILLRLEREDIQRFEMICRHIGRVLPVFDRFQIEESYRKVLLRWKAKGMDKTFGAHLTSDGSLRFFALVTLLNLPPEMLPAVILLDEPELGLHPAAVTLVGGMIKSLSRERQVIVATQSPLFVDTFSLDEIVVLELQDGRTEVRRLDENEYQRWLNDYTTGELWQKNLLGGSP